MSRYLLLAIGLGLALLGGATAFDVVSLRELAHSLNVPVLSGLVIGLREAMPTYLAHAIEPAVGMLGALVIGWPLALRITHSTIYRSYHWSPSSKFFVRVFARRRIHSDVVILMSSS